MRLLIKTDNVTKMSMIDMSIYTEQPLQYCLGYSEEVLGKRDT